MLKQFEASAFPISRSWCAPLDELKIGFSLSDRATSSCARCPMQAPAWEAWWPEGEAEPAAA
jgi:hypothetical protein